MNKSSFFFTYGHNYHSMFVGNTILSPFNCFC